MPLVDLTHCPAFRLKIQLSIVVLVDSTQYHAFSLLTHYHTFRRFKSPVNHLC